MPENDDVDNDTFAELAQQHISSTCQPLDSPARPSPDSPEPAKAQEHKSTKQS